MINVVEVEIVGTAPLLQHRFAQEEQTDEPKIVKGKPNREGEVERALYRSPDGTIYQPSSHLERCMVKASSRYQIGGRGKKTYKDLFGYAVLVSPEAIPLGFEEMVVDERAVIINKARIIRRRPRFDKWGLKFEIQITEEQLPVKVLNTVLVDAGQTVGIGDYRPKFGRFMVTKFQPK